jgi:hypothetical protein
MKMKMMQVEALRALRVLCVWDGCQRNFKGAMPKGWRWLVTYWATEPRLALGPSPEVEWDCDAALCPTHVRAPDGQLRTSVLKSVAPGDF